MSATIICRGLSYTFPAHTMPALGDVSIELPAGNWTLLAGPSGAGKSTLLHALAGLLDEPRTGLRQGQIAIDGCDPQQLPAARRAALVGLVQQSADQQICTTTVESEIAFGLENLALDPDQIDRRIDEALALVGLDEQRRRRVTELSGGQRQRLVLAAVLAMRPSVLLLDEPLSQLDPAAAAQFLDALDRLRDGGPTIVVAEHRVAPWRTRVDQVLTMEAGRIASQLVPSDESAWEVPFAKPPARLSSKSPPANAPSLVEIERLEFWYDRRLPLVLNGIDLAIRDGERVAIVGANGSGKSTLLALLAGLYAPTMGLIRFDQNASVGLVQQNPDSLLFCRTVREELAFAPRHQGVIAREIELRVQDAARRFDLTELLVRQPILLSQGERLRVAVAATFTLHAPLLLLDEPTTGQDPEHEAQLMRTLTDAVRSGGPPRALVFSTHDLSVARNWSDRAVVIEEGCVVVDDSPDAAIDEFERRLDDARLLRSAT